MTDLFPSELTVNSRSVNVQKIKLRCVLFVLRKKLVSYFASNKRGMTIIINYELKYITADDNAIFVKVKKITINFRNLFDTAIGLRVLEMA